MRFKKREHALRHLREIFGKTKSDIELESYLVESLLFLDDKYVYCGTRCNKFFRELIGIGKSIGLWPVPDWFIVRERLKGPKKRRIISVTKERVVWTNNTEG